MADFVSPGWGIYITIVTLLSIVFCIWLTLVLARGRVPGQKVDTTGHCWDEDLEEYNNPLPRWWLGLYLLTCLFAFVYLALYPGLGTFQGLLGWSQKGQYEQEVARVEEATAPLFATYLKQDIPTVAADAQARAMGERLYLTYCVQCHGSDARGSRGFPNLTDDDWLYGGDPDAIRTTITDGRNGVMPPMAAAIGDATDVNNVANYVLSLSGSRHDAAAAEAGREKFLVCAACHGEDGTGNQAIGSPDLTDQIWLYGSGLSRIVEAIELGRTNRMPAFGQMLSEGRIHLLTAYIWGLSNHAAPTDDANTSPAAVNQASGTTSPDVALAPEPVLATTR